MKSRKLKLHLRRLVIFMLCSTSGTIVELVVVWLCSTFLFHNYVGQYVVSSIIAFECAVVVDFVFYSRILWRKRSKGIGFRSYLVRLLKFNLSALGVYLLRLALIQAMGLAWHLHVVWCEMISMCFSGTLNYIISENLIFKKNKPKKNCK